MIRFVFLEKFLVLSVYARVFRYYQLLPISLRKKSDTNHESSPKSERIVIVFVPFLPDKLYCLINTVSFKYNIHLKILVRQIR